MLRRFICTSTQSLKHFVVRPQEIQATALCVYEYSQSMAYFIVQCSCANINDSFAAATLTWLLTASVLRNNLELYNASLNLLPFYNVTSACASINGSACIFFVIVLDPWLIFVLVQALCQWHSLLYRDFSQGHKNRNIISGSVLSNSPLGVGGMEKGRTFLDVGWLAVETWALA